MTVPPERRPKDVLYGREKPLTPDDLDDLYGEIAELGRTLKTFSKAHASHRDSMTRETQEDLLAIQTAMIGPFQGVARNVYRLLLYNVPKQGVTFEIPNGTRNTKITLALGQIRMLNEGDEERVVTFAPQDPTHYYSSPVKLTAQRQLRGNHLVVDGSVELSGDQGLPGSISSVIFTDHLSGWYLGETLRDVATRGREPYATAKLLQQEVILGHDPLIEVITEGFGAVQQYIDLLRNQEQPV